MDNAQAAEKLNLFGDLLELTESNPFRARAFHNAARSVLGLAQPFSELLKQDQITSVPGIGKGMAATLRELDETGRFMELDTLLERVPAGVLEMRRVPGLGGKKLRALYQDSGIRSLEELEKACQDGTLESLSGYGAKSVAKILDGIHQVRSFIGQWRRPRAITAADAVVALLRACQGVAQVQVAGPLARNMETVERLDWVVSGACTPKSLTQALAQSAYVVSADITTSDRVDLGLIEGLKGAVHCVGPEDFGSALLSATGPEPYVNFVRQKATGPFRTEAEWLVKAGLPWLPPECRDLESFWTSGVPTDLVRGSDLRGVLHCHSTYSDGKASLADMVAAAYARGLAYFGICDHSRSAAYAGGLSVDRLREQHQEIERLNTEYAGRLRIFRGIESDILVDGSLDYPDEVLAQFDFVVASVHSGLDMDEGTATVRVCKAIRNPYTTILGHATGRLLLMRRGFPLNWEKVVSAATESGTLIELNGNPRRLDVDWRHLPLLFSEGVRISINPDAHTQAGIDDMQHGVAVARKAGTRPEQVLNTLEVDQIARFFAETRP